MGVPLAFAHSARRGPIVVVWYLTWMEFFQNDPEPAAVARFGLDLDAATVLLGDAFADRQSRAGAFDLRHSVRGDKLHNVRDQVLQKQRQQGGVSAQQSEGAGGNLGFARLEILAVRPSSTSATILSRSATSSASPCVSSMRTN